MKSHIEEIDRAAYLSFATFRRNGTAVETPVWFAGHEDVLYLFSAGDAGKVKRLRNSAKARVAVCDLRGKLLGDWLDAEAVVINEPGECGIALRALRRKYGWQMISLDLFSRLSGRFHRRAYIRVYGLKSPLSENQ